MQSTVRVRACVQEYHVDGFRFDLASILTRAPSAWHTADWTALSRIAATTADTGSDPSSTSSFDASDTATLATAERCSFMRAATRGFQKRFRLFTNQFVRALNTP